MRRILGKRRVVVSVIVAALAVALLGVAAPAGAQKGKVPGVTADEIRVCGVAGVTNPTGVPYQDGFIGIQANFAEINKKGGVFGRELKLVGKYDDQTRDSKNISAVRACVEDDKAFAVAPMVTQTFAGAKYLVDEGVPTFGWNIQSQWSLGPNLFAEKGSYLCFDCPNWTPVYIAQQVGAKKAACLRLRLFAAVGRLREQHQEQLREVELPVRVHRHAASRSASRPTTCPPSCRR